MKKPKFIEISTISLILLLTTSALIAVLPSVIAQEPIRFEPVPYINAVPNPVQVNNPTLFHVGSVYPTPTQHGGWSGLEVEITNPQGGIDTLGPIQTDTTGGTGVMYTPTMVGTYTIRTYFPEQILTANSNYIGPAGTIMEESYSEELELVVQDEPIPFYPGHPLPSEYWTRPIDGQIREWYTIAGNWLQYIPPTNSDPHTINAPFNDYAPESAHVLWSKPITMGGLAGGATGHQGFEQGDAYEGKFGGGGLFGAGGPVILGGVLYYNQYEPRGGSNVEQTVVAVDIKTGEELWNRPLTTPDGDILRLAFGQNFYWDSYNYHGVFPYLWGTVGGGFSPTPLSWHAFDPFTGRWEYTMEDVPGGVSVYGDNGEILRYNVNTNAGTMTLWNSSRVVSNAGSWRPHGNTYNASAGIEWTVDIPELVDLPGNVYKVRKGVILGANFARGGPAPDPVTMWAIRVDAQDGDAELMWDRTWPVPSGAALISVEDVSEEEDLFIVSTKETRVTYGFRLSTGAELWGPTPSRHYTDNWGHSSGNSWDFITEDKVIAGNYGGTVWCYNAETGDVEWTFDIVDPYTEILHNNRWRFRPVLVSGGKLYIENTEHNPRDPQPRGAPFICLDLETGEQIFRIPYRGSEWSSTPIIADSTIVLYNEYDQRIYALGKGPSSTTVEAPLLASSLGSTVTIRGTVTDVSPGTESAAVKLRFPNGVPVVADADMTDWMLYVYNQFPKPMAMGIQVKIESYDPNGNYQLLGTTTTDPYGNFGLTYEPEVPGTYYIFATFEGTDSYYGSSSSTYFSVDPAPTLATPIEPELPEVPEEPETPTEPEEPETPEEPEQPAETPLISTEIAIVAAVAVAAVIGVAAFWFLRKRG